MKALDLAGFGSRFDAALMEAIAQQEPHVAQRLLAELHAGNFEVDVSEERLLTVRIGGAVILEAHLYPEATDAPLN